VLVVAAALLSFVARLRAQSVGGDSATRADGGAVARRSGPLPFRVGEELVFRATFGRIPAGSAKMSVVGIDTIGGRPAYHLVFSVDGGIPFFRVHDRYESWMDTATLSSVRYVQRIAEGRYKRETIYEFFQSERTYRKNGGEPQPTVADPLDDGSFIYAARIANVRVGDTIRAARYFIPDRNPVEFIGERAESLTVGAGRFDAVVVRPRIKTNGIFSDRGDAHVWFSSGDARFPLKVTTKFAGFSLTLTLQSVTMDASNADRR
jgi:hypothetical protein